MNTWDLFFKIGPLAIFATVMMWDNWRIRGDLFKVRARNATLANQVATLQAHPDSWQSGYNAGRKMGTATAYSERNQLNRLLESAKQDSKRLDSGMIMIAGRDEFGEPTRTHARGLNLRQMIDEAVEEHTL